MVTASFINRLSRAVDRIENQSQPRPWKVVQIYCGYGEDMDVARARHYAAHPEDRDANVLLFKFCDGEDLAEED